MEEVEEKKAEPVEPLPSPKETRMIRTHRRQASHTQACYFDGCNEPLHEAHLK